MALKDITWNGTYNNVLAGVENSPVKNERDSEVRGFPAGGERGGTGRNRTANLEFRKLLLYPIELRPRGYHDSSQGFDVYAGRPRI